MEKQYHNNNYNLNTVSPQFNILNKQLHQYKKINATLKKKIKAKQRQINYLFNCIDQYGKVVNFNHHHINNNEDEIFIEESMTKSKNIGQYQPRKQILTEVKKKQKENFIYNNHNPQTNIFKNISYRQIGKINKQDFRLPSLGRNSIFSEDYNQHQGFSHFYQESFPKQKIIRVSIEKLVPLKPQEVKKKFQMKYKSQIIHQ